jgi:hypothetical protein
MSELTAVAALVAGTCGFIVLGVTIGTRFIERVVSTGGKSRDNAPLVRPAHPSGAKWHSVDAV